MKNLSDNATIQVNGERLRVGDLVRCPQCGGVVMTKVHHGIYMRGSITAEGLRTEAPAADWTLYTCTSCGASVTETPTLITTDDDTPDDIQRMWGLIESDHYRVKLRPDSIELLPPSPYQRTYSGTTFREAFAAFEKGRTE